MVSFISARKAPLQVKGADYHNIAPETLRVTISETTGTPNLVLIALKF